MGKTRIIAFVVLILAVAVGFFVLRMRPGTPADKTTGQVTLRIEQGKVELQDARASEWRVATDGEVLSAGVKIRTAADTHAFVDFYGVAMGRLGVNTEIALDSFEMEANSKAMRVSVEVTKGTIWSRVLKLLDVHASYEVKTPSTVSVVRGTAFGVSVTVEGTFVYPGESVVETTVIATGEKFEIKDDDALAVRADGATKVIHPSEDPDLRAHIDAELELDRLWMFNVDPRTIINTKTDTNIVVPTPPAPLTPPPAPPAGTGSGNGTPQGGAANPTTR